MQEPSPKGIIQFSSQHEQDLHAGVKKPLEQLGHTGTTIPPKDAPPLTEEARKWIEEKTRDVVHIADVSVNTGEEAKIRFAREKEPTSIIAGRWLKKKLLGKAA